MNNLVDLKQLALVVHQRLLNHFGRPNWGNPMPPLDEMISTILSQNTNDRNRDAAYRNLRKTFPTWEAVRDADIQSVIATIQTAGLGNTKGPRIQAILKQITDERGSLELGFLKEMEPDEIHAWLGKFKGIGPKTIAIVMLFSLGIPAFPVDTHIYRVSGRLGLRPMSMTIDQAHYHLATLFPSAEYGSAHLNIIRLGREICSSRKPQCVHCPLQDLCPYPRQ